MKFKLSLLAFAMVMIVSNVFPQIPEIVEGWPYITTSGMWAVHTRPQFSMNEDIDSCAVFFNTLKNEIIKFHIDGTFYDGWPIIEEEVLFGGTPSIVDIDHDGKDELIIVGSRRDEDNHYLYTLLYIIDDDGNIFPGFPQIYYRISPPNIADYDNDGEYELIFLSIDDYEIYCIDMYGNSETGWPVESPEDISGGVAVGDLDLDGYLEYIVKGYKNIYAYRYNGVMQDGFPISVIDTAYFFNLWFGPSLADVNQDGYPEILVSAYRTEDLIHFDSYVAVYQYNGELLEHWPLMFPGQCDWQMPIAADINNDNLLEIGFAVGESTYFVDVNGNNLPGWPATFTLPDGRPRVPMSDIIVVDIDGDGDCEIFMDFNVAFFDSSEGYFSYLFAHDHLGQLLPGYPIIVKGDYLDRPPTFAYHNNSNSIYMGLCTEISYTPYIDTVFLDVYIFPDSTGPPDQWPMLGHDNLMTRNYNFVDNVTSIDDENKIIPKNYILKQNYPNPFNNSTVIEFSLPDDEYINLSVYDILGRRVDKLVDGKLTAGQHRITWCNKDVSSGIYFYVLKTEKTRINRRMTVLQ